MANIYNSNLTTRYLEPVNHSNTRTEFRLDNNSVYLSNLRLINVGATCDANTAVTQMRGTNAIIKSIALYSGNQLLDQVTDMNLWETYTRTLSTNERQTTKGALNNGSGGLVSVQNDEFEKDEFPMPPSTKLFNRRNQTPNAFPINTTADPLNTSSWMSVQGVLSFLSNSVHLPTGIIKDLRLVVLYNGLTEFNKASGANNVTSVTPIKPLLVADELNPSETRDAMVRDYQGVSYTPVEQERVILPAVAGTSDSTAPVEQSKTFLLTGFNNKYVEKLICYQQLTDPSTWDVGGGANLTRTGAYGCPPQFNPVIQWRVNGQNKYPGIGLQGHNRALAMLVDHVGDSSFVPGGNTIGVVGNANVYDTSLGELPYHNGYTCMPIELDISELQLTFGRDGVSNDPATKGELFINIFGIVRKQLALRNNGQGFVISYV